MSDTDHYITMCSDRGCVLRPARRGQCTNGGCRHLIGGPHGNAQARAMGAEIVRLRAELTDARSYIRSVSSMGEPVEGS